MNVLYLSIYKQFCIVFSNWEKITSPKKAFFRNVFVFSCYLISLLNIDANSFVFKFLQNSKQLRLLIFKAFNEAKPKNMDRSQHLFLINQSFELLFLTNCVTDSQKVFLEKYKKFLLDIISKKRVQKTFLYYSHTSLTSSNKKLLKDSEVKIFYIYRLTFINPLTGSKFYYYGYRGTTLPPTQDTDYWSSRENVKELIKTFGETCFRKKILGLYICQLTTLKREISLHDKFDVKNNPQFLNLANQTSEKFNFDCSGKKQDELSNQKRSEALLNRVISPETRKKISETHLTRERSAEETLSRRQFIQALNKRVAVCPHCQRTIGIPGGYRWHFKNCTSNPNPTEKSIQDREQLRNRAILRNTSEKPPRKNKKS
jgi:hypothetical protein